MKEITLIQKNPRTITREDVDGINIKYVPNTNELYAASRDGILYSFSYKMAGKPIGSSGPGGYLTASIQYAEGKREVEYVHRIIATVFIPNPYNKKQVDHINEDRKDNRVDNLCWATGKENCNYGSHNEKLAASIKEYYKNRHVFGKVAKRVMIIDAEGNELTITPSIQAAADWIKTETGKDNNASAVQISAILQGKPGFKTVGGFRVKEVSEEEYQAWVAKDINTLVMEEDIDLSLVPMGKMSKIDGVKVVNRRMNMATGEMEFEVREFDKGQKLTNELR